MHKTGVYKIGRIGITISFPAIIIDTKVSTTIIRYPTIKTISTDPIKMMFFEKNKSVLIIFTVEQTSLLFSFSKTMANDKKALEIVTIVTDRITKLNPKRLDEN